MAPPESDLRGERAATNQSLFREVNERVEDIAKALGLQQESVDFICECAHKECPERLEMTVAEYEAVRRVPTHFAVAEGHELPDVERVVNRTSRYNVVAKFGVAGDLAMELDPRTPSNT
jgi:hypothetical protein